MNQWEVVIGIETHAQLATVSKIFSGASTAFGAEANTQACAVDLALPGVLPVLNKKAVEFAKKLKSGKTFDLNDFKEQIGQMRKMGGMSSLMDKLPAQFAQAAGQLPVGTEDKMVRRIEGIINSMTPAERSKPDLIKASRKRRIATGAGVQVQEVNRLLNQFEQMQKMMKQFSKGGMGKLMRGMKGMIPGMR